MLSSQGMMWGGKRQEEIKTCKWKASALALQNLKPEGKEQKVEGI